MAIFGKKDEKRLVSGVYSVEFLPGSTKSFFVIVYAYTVPRSIPMTTTPVEYQVKFALRKLESEWTNAFRALEAAVYEDAALGYPAIAFDLKPEYIHEKERAGHPWLNEELKLTTETPEHELALIGISDIWFNEHADAMHTYDFPALVMCRPETLDRVRDVNAVKNRFKEVIKAIRDSFAGMSDKDIDKEVKKALEDAGMARLCLKQVYRLIPFIDTPGLMRAKFYLNPKRPSRCRTVGEQLAIYEEKIQKGEGTKTMVRAMEKLQGLNKNMEISERQESSPVMTVNYRMRDKISGKNSKNEYLNYWGQKTAALPVFCVADPVSKFDTNSVPILETIVDFSSLEKKYVPKPEREKKPAFNQSQLIWSEKPIVDKSRLFLKHPNKIANSVPQS